MNIKALSDITGVNPETIRMYRNQGLLNPPVKDNGYYDYQMKDLIALTYLRKLRSYRYSLDKIQNVYHADSPSDILNLMSDQEILLNSQINDLNTQLKIIQYEKKHLERAIESVDEGAHFSHYGVDRVDILNLEDIKPYQDRFSMFMPTIRISKDILNGEIEDRIIPAEVGLGTLTQFLEESGLPIPKNARYVPAGNMIIQPLEVHNFGEINLLDLSPMMTYAKKHHMIFTDDTTAALITARKVGDDIVCWFTIRAQAEERK